MHVPPTPEKAVATQKAVAFYEMLTGLTVSVNGSQVHCSCGGEQRPLSFEIDLAPVGDENNEVLPSDIGFTAKELGDCADRLPDYMQDYLTCARARAPTATPSLPSALAQPHPPTHPPTHPPSPASRPTLPRTRACAVDQVQAPVLLSKLLQARFGRWGRGAEAAHARGRASPESIVDGGTIAGSAAPNSSPRELPATSLCCGVAWVAPWCEQPRLGGAPVLRG